MSSDKSSTAPEVRRRWTSDCSKGGRTRQSEHASTDINKIVARLSVGATVPQSVLGGAKRSKAPMYADVSQSPTDYQAALDVVLRARDSFAALPARLRDRFGNDPVGLLRFLENPDNLEESYNLGLRERPVPPPKAEVVDPETGEISPDPDPDPEDLPPESGKRAAKPPVVKPKR